MSGTESKFVQRSRSRRARPLLLGLTAAFAIIPAVQSTRGDALPPSVARTVEQVQGAHSAQPAQFVRPAANMAQRMLDERLRSIGNAFNGDVGIAVKDLQTGWTSHFDGASHFPQQSVSKFWVTLTALNKADRGELSRHSPVTVRKSDLTLFNQPIAQKVGANGYTTTLTELMRRAMQQSDNTCNDFVLWRAGGPDAVRDFMARNGISGVRFGPGEREMQSKIAGMEWKSSYVGNAFYAARNAVPASIRRASFL
ncbi:MAG TPA: serine hydrolase, partial [Allosphingosinicella sp.]|nr:serine hydrolase [Allosphingosinicella sp.]